jgi:hypothetical protein
MNPSKKKSMQGSNAEETSGTKAAALSDTLSLKGRGYTADDVQPALSPGDKPGDDRRVRDFHASPMKIRRRDPTLPCQHPASKVAPRFPDFPPHGS